MPKGIYDRKPVAERFWSRVRKASGCWLWAGCFAGNGYGAIKNRGRQDHAHRVSWELHYGEIPAGLCVLHHCDNRACVNPNHLFLGSHRDNALDCQRKGRANTARGENAGHAKLTENQVRRIKLDSRVMRLIAAEYDIHLQHVYRIKHGQRWKHLKGAMPCL